MEKIGRLTAVDYRSFIVPPGDDVWTEVELDGWKAKLNLKFHLNGDTPGIKIEAEDGYGRIIFQKWDSNLGVSTSEPAQFARHPDGRLAFFMAVIFLIGTSPESATIKLDIQFLLEPKL